MYRKVVVYHLTVPVFAFNKVKKESFKNFFLGFGNDTFRRLENIITPMKFVMQMYCVHGDHAGGKRPPSTFRMVRLLQYFILKSLGTGLRKLLLLVYYQIITPLSNVCACVSCRSIWEHAKGVLKPPRCFLDKK